jgi:tetratricopeptide (TPR) repeat protein
MGTCGVGFIFSTLLAFAAAGGWSTSVEGQLAAGKWRDALTALNGIDPDSRDSGWHLLASKAYDGLNEPAQAAAEAQEAMRLAPRSEAAYLQLAQIFLSRNTPQPAYEILSEAATQFPDSLLVRLGLGLSLQELQRYDQAIPILAGCLRQKPDLAAAFDALGSSYLDSSRYDELLDASTEYMRRNPADFRGYYYQAAALEKLRRDPSETEALLRRAIERNPQFAASHALLGKILMNSGRPELAAASLEEAIRLRPDYTPAHYYLANVYRTLGRAPDAKREFAEVARLKEEESKPTIRLSYHRGSLSPASNQK